MMASALSNCVLHQLIHHQSFMGVHDEGDIKKCWSELKRWEYSIDIGGWRATDGYDGWWLVVGGAGGMSPKDR